MVQYRIYTSARGLLPFLSQQIIRQNLSSYSKKKKKLEILCQNLILLFIGQNKKKERKKIWGNKVHVQLNNVLHMLASSCSLRMFVLLLTTLRMLWISFYPVLFANVTCLTSSGSWVWDLWKSLIISYTISF